MFAVPLSVGLLRLLVPLPALLVFFYRCSVVLLSDLIYLSKLRPYPACAIPFRFPPGTAQHLSLSERKLADDNTLNL